MDIVRLDENVWKGYVLPMGYTTCEYYDVVPESIPSGMRVSLIRKRFAAPVRHTPEEYDFPDRLFRDHWKGAFAYGIEKDGRLLAAIELFEESWAKRLRVTELWVDESLRRRGTGSRLMDIAKAETVSKGLRMLILETQSCNTAAIDFYRSQGLTLVGLSACDYTNDDIARKEVRFEMGWFVPAKS